jgi:hypothetical protein
MGLPQSVLGRVRKLRVTKGDAAAYTARMPHRCVALLIAMAVAGPAAATVSTAAH